MSRVAEMLNPNLFTPRPRAPSYPEGVPADVCDLFEKIALEVAACGFDRYSARALAHRIRWHEQIDRGNREFIFNNNWSPALARWFIARHPHLSDFFELRKSPNE